MEAADLVHFTRTDILDEMRIVKALIRTAENRTPPNEGELSRLKAELQLYAEALANAPPGPALQPTTQSDYTLMMRQQSLRDAMRDILTFEPGTDVNRFITNINKIYMIHVKPDLTDYPGLEGEFLRLAQQRIDPGVVQQMLDSRQKVESFSDLKTYLMTYHGSQMSTFQHLSKAWDLQRRDGERLTDFAGRLETTILEAATHVKEKFRTSNNNAEITADGVFALMGAMLMSEKIKAWTPNVYPHMVRNMDNHYSAVGIASDAQRYLDRGIKTDQAATTENSAFHSYNTTHNRPHNDTADEPGIKDLVQQMGSLTKYLKDAHQHQTDSLTKYINDSHHRPVNSKYQTPPYNNNRHGGQYNRRGKDRRASSNQICRNYMDGRPCRYGQNCQFRHPNKANAAIASTPYDETNHTSPSEEQDFFQGPVEM